MVLMSRCTEVCSVLYLGHDGLSGRLEFLAVMEVCSNVRYNEVSLIGLSGNGQILQYPLGISFRQLARYLMS